MLRFLRTFGVTALVIAFPLSVSSATVAELLTTKDDAAVTRGEFIRASISASGVKVEKSTSMPRYSRPVPKALQPYISTAEKRGALAQFGKDLKLNSSITRGEAATLLMYLLDVQPSFSDATFSDIPAGSAMERAARVAVEQEWMQPIRPNFFAASRTLTGAEGRRLLQKALGEQATSVETGTSNRSAPIVVKIRGKETVELPEYELLKTVWQLMSDQYLYKEKISNKEAAYKAAEALINSAGDPYTVFMRPADAKNFQETIDGEIIGIGAQVEYKDNALTVIAPISGSPAEKAGVKPGDVITAVDGESIAGLNLIQAVQKVRGPKGTTVTLSITRNGTSVEISVTRDTVKMPEIDISFQQGVAVVKLVQFGQTTDRDLRSYMADVQQKKPSGIVLDLRNNPGGLLHAAEIVLSNFLPEGSGVAMIKSKSQKYTEVTQDPPTIDKDVKIVVLVNKGSASASEIVAGALQDHKRATIMGETTFGKGTVQQIVEFRDGSSMKMTVAEWLTPKGRVINGVGVTPDVQLTLVEGRDEVLLRAIDSLR